SLKGVFRTRAEKIIRTINYHRKPESYDERLCACGITHAEDEYIDRLSGCFGTKDKQKSAKLAARDNNRFARELYDKSCVTCRIFGNSLMRGRLHFSDAELAVEKPYAKLFDHVAIDRFHGGAAEQHKFDDRPLMPQVSDDGSFIPVFKFHVHLERPEPWMLGILALLLKDLVTNDIRIGGKTTRGYGKVKGSVIYSEILVLPGSKLYGLCKVLPGKDKLGPYTRKMPYFECIFKDSEWDGNGLDKSLRTVSTATILEQCYKKFLNIVQLEEGKPHGSF
ncbi:hypothetical protein GF312_03945, partial [Candidatus Poribacteria bacterium]|nr:hypothetical protein [Candidatus Poribacteria bacterium]